MKILAGLVLCLAVVIGLVALTVGGILLMRRDRHRSGSSGMLSGAMLEVQSLLEPAQRHVVRSVRAEEPEDREVGEGPPPDDLP